MKGMNWYNTLANAIITQAVWDYRDSLRGRIADKTMSVENMLKDCEKFFKSEWFAILTKIDGEVLMKKLQEEYHNECKPCTRYKKPNRNNI